jgi:capsular polysaccharide transport system permease protein
MTVANPTDSDESGTNEPIKFMTDKDERRAERQRRRAERKANAEESTEVVVAAAAPNVRTLPTEKNQPAKTVVEVSPSPKKAARERKQPRMNWTVVSFLLMVLVPTAVVSVYFEYFASPQYRVDAQFAVRGSSSAATGMLGLTGLLGTTGQSGDSYIVATYIQSPQLIRDVKNKLGIDLRKYYSKPGIDWWYRIDPKMPVEQFVDYWAKVTEVSYNSTTGNTELYVYGFSAQDSKDITDAVMRASETLVNALSDSSLEQMTRVASHQVDRAEVRLKKVRQEITDLQEKQKTLNPTSLVGAQQAMVASLESQITALEQRQHALLKEISADSPSARVLQRQIDAAQAALDEEKAKIGSETSTNTAAKNLPADQRNLADAIAKFEELTVEQTFATQAYTAALSAFETSLVEAQKQDRYFATFVDPSKPEISLYPERGLNSFIGFLIFTGIWLLSQFFYRSIRDHAI